MLFGLWVWSLWPTSPQSIHWEDVGLKLHFSPSWQVKTEGVGPLAVVAELAPNKALAVLARQTMVETESPEVAIKEALGSIENAYSEHVILKNDKAAFGKNIKGHVIMVRGSAKGMSLRNLTYLFWGFGERFSLTFTLKEEHFENLIPDLSAVANSLELLGPNPMTTQFIDLVSAKETDYEAMEKLLQAGADINGVDARQLTALGRAVIARKGPLVKWLLAKGADPRKPESTARFLTLAATPPIRELLKNRLRELQPEKEKKLPSPPKSSDQLQIAWRSPEAQLFSGIKNGRIGYVREAVSNGADLQSTKNDYQLPALAFTRKLIEEFKELDLEHDPWKAIEQFLAEQEVEKR